MNTLFVLLPCYNEAQDIQALLIKWKNTEKILASTMDCAMRVVAINDGSTDQTLALLGDFCPDWDCLAVLDHGVNRGLGHALVTGLRYFQAHAAPGDFAVVMDADNTHNPNYVLDMLRKQRESGCGCVIASRYCQNSAVNGVPLHRNLMSLAARGLYCLFLRVPNVKDYTCGYRLYTIKSIESLFATYGEQAITQSGFACMAEALYKLHLCGVKCAEVPFVLEYGLKQGESKMKLLSTIKNSLKIIFGLRRIGREKHVGQTH